MPVKPAHALVVGEFVADRRFYGTIEHMIYPVGTQTVIVVTQGGYCHRVQRDTLIHVA